MITKINNSVKLMMCAALLTSQFSLLTSCDDMLDTTSELVEFQEDNTLNHPTDSVYSVLGIVGRMQTIADRTVILGEARADLMVTTDAASAHLKNIAEFNFTGANKYNQVSDYYAVINNCNYYIANVDTALERRGRKLFLYEYAAVKAFRAWTYLELVKNYGSVPLFTEPVMTEREAFAAATNNYVGIKELCDFFIADLTPYAYVEKPKFGSPGGWNADRFFIPMRALLGDLCLWAGRYKEAAQWYNSFLNDRDDPQIVSYSNRSRWTSVSNFSRPQTGYNVRSDREVISFIPMESRIFDGIISDLPNVFNSTNDNNYFYQLTPSAAMRSISAKQIYCMEYLPVGGTQTDTIYTPRTGLSDDMMIGDLRLYSNYSLRAMGGQDEYSEYNVQRQNIEKIWTDRVPTYRTNIVYLRYAEALNRAGFPQSAMSVLKYGLCEDKNKERIDSIERVEAGALINFDATYFTREATIGIHSLGSGDSHCNAYYDIPMPSTQLPTRQDTINYQIPLIEDMIVEEMALEGAFEGYRFYDLMRVALRRGDAAYLADPISRRNGQVNEALRQQLLNPSNWYLPLPAIIE
jgi:hypothetical protein